MARGSVTPRPGAPGMFRVRVYLGRDDNGRSRYLERSVKGKRAAEQVAAELVAVHGGGQRADGAITLSRWLTVWIARLERDGRSPTTIASYRLVARHAKSRRLGQARLVDLRPSDFDAHYDALAAAGLSPSTVAGHHRVLRAAMRAAWRAERIPQVVADKASPPRVPQRGFVLPTDAAVGVVVRSALASHLEGDRETGRAVVLLVRSGMRRGELCGLQWADVDWRERGVTVRRAVVRSGAAMTVKAPKSGRTRWVALDDDTMAVLDAQRVYQVDRARWGGGTLSADAFVFPATTDTTGRTPARPDRWSHAWRRLADREGLDARLHDLRHLQASTLLDAGLKAQDVAARLGHASPAVTAKIYSHQLAGRDRDAADVAGLMLARPVGPCAGDPLPAGPTS
jgi:integrase